MVPLMDANRTIVCSLCPACGWSLPHCRCGGQVFEEVILSPVTRVLTREERVEELLEELNGLLGPVGLRASVGPV